MNTRTSNNRNNKRRPQPKRRPQSPKKALDPSNFVKEAQAVKVKKFTPSVSYEEMDVHPKLKEAILHKGYINPTEIQERSIPDLIDGSDIVGVANTGTGKTGAFLIPIIHNLLYSKKKFETLIVLPTRELALQVETEFKSLTKGMKLYSTVLIGGTNINKDISKLSRRSDLIIGTPGRIMDMMNRRVLKLRDFKVLVLDEFDRMLDMGFVRDVKKISGAMPNREQTMLFSATIDKTQAEMIKTLVHKPVEVKVSSGQSSTDTVAQEVIKVGEQNKFQLLKDLLKDEDLDKAIIFLETKHRVNQLSKKLNKVGFESDVIHGGKSQNYRVKALEKFKKGKVKILIATDVAARGIDIADISHVINYQTPTSMDSYIHRIGRTGRAGKTGKAFTFVD